MIKFPITCIFLIIGTTLYSVLSEETTIPYNNPFFKEVADLICKPEPSNEQLEAIKTNCKQNFEEKPIDPWPNCTGMATLTDRQRFQAICNVTVANCASDLFSKVTPAPGTKPKSAEEFDKFKLEYMACVKKSIGKV